MKSHFFVDIHCHPSIKAFARSFKTAPGVQEHNPKALSSLWRRDAPSLFDKVKNLTVQLTNFIQSDASSLMQGRVCVVCLSFYPLEKPFFVNKAGHKIASDTLTKLATEFGQQRIDHIQQLSSYWEDLKMEMNFLQQQENKIKTIDGKKVSYKIARSYADIEAADLQGELGETMILFVPTIEGCHIFDQAMNAYEPWNLYPGGVSEERLEIMLSRIAELRESRNGLIRPAFVTLAHHFWNGLCGHARSLGNLIKCFVDQENGLEPEQEIGLREAGRKAIIALMGDATDANGRPLPPVYIDIKHMSRTSRLQYFEFLETEFAGKNIPLIVSHAGVTGLSEPNGLAQTPAAKEGLFMTDPINFFDDEIVRICRSNGIFGIQLDERRIGSKQAIRKAKGYIAKRDVLYAFARLVWNQVRHIAEVLDINNEFAWGIQALGTDFDGIIDPIDGYWTSRQLDDLDDYLLKHAYNYIKGVDEPCPLLQARNRNIKAEEIVDRVMTSNALGLLSRIY